MNELTSCFPTLQDICADMVINTLANNRGDDSTLLQIYSLAKRYNIVKLRDFARVYIRDRFAYFLDKLGEGLEERLGEDFAAMRAMHEERIKAEAFLSRRVFN